MCLFWQPWYSFSRRQSLQSQTEKKETLYQQANHLWSKQRGEAGPLKCACVPFWGATGATRFDKNSILSRTLAVIQLSSCRVDPSRIHVTDRRLSAPAVSCLPSSHLCVMSLPPSSSDSLSDPSVASTTRLSGYVQLRESFQKGFVCSATISCVESWSILHTPFSIFEWKQHHVSPVVGKMCFFIRGDLTVNL